MGVTQAATGVAKDMFKVGGLSAVTADFFPRNLGPVHTSPKSLQADPSLRAWKMGLTTSHGVSNPKYDMDAYMAVFFLEGRLGTCV